MPLCSSLLVHGPLFWALFFLCCVGTSIQDPAVVHSCDGQVRVGQVSPLLLTIVHAKLPQVKYSKAVVESSCVSYFLGAAPCFKISLLISHNFRHFLLLHCIYKMLLFSINFKVIFIGYSWRQCR